MERGDWSDARITDAFRSVWERLNALDRTNERLATMEAVLPEVRRELMAARASSSEEWGECRTAIQALSEAFSQRAAAREAERKAAVVERKKDRRWWAATALAAGTLVVGALAILIPLLTAGPP